MTKKRCCTVNGSSVRSSPKGWRQKILPGAAAFLERVKQKLEQQVDVYICCFCLKDDLLSQWRGYGANGSGVSMGIDPQEFEWLTGPDSPPGGLLRVWKVFYEEDRQREIIKELLHCGLGQPGTPEERAENTAAAIQFFVPTFKNASFHAEEECRMIFTPAAGFQIAAQVPDSRRYACSLFIA